MLGLRLSERQWVLQTFLILSRILGVFLELHFETIIVPFSKLTTLACPVKAAPPCFTVVPPCNLCQNVALKIRFLPKALPNPTQNIAKYYLLAQSIAQPTFPPNHFHNNHTFLFQAPVGKGSKTKSLRWDQLTVWWSLLKKVLAKWCALHIVQ